MVTVALALPLLILLASFAVDVGNWFEHQRHLQLQADAGALAAAGDFRYPCNEAIDTTIEGTAEKYGGATPDGYNHQVGGATLDDVHLLINEPHYYNQPSTTDPNPVERSPCASGTIDVKLTETDLPLFFRVAGLFTNVPFINAHARVQVFEKQNVSGALPVAVPDPNPQKARVEFVDEESGEVLGSHELSKEENGENGLAIWDNKTEPLSLTVGEGHERIGMRVALSGGSSTTCGEPLVECYEAESPDGIVFVRGYSMAGSGAQQEGPPLARSVYLLSGTCKDPYFTAGSCSTGLHADVDFGPCEAIEEVGARLTAVAGKTTSEMTMTGCQAGTSSSEWETKGAPIQVPAEAGPVPVILKWKETKGELEGQGDCSKGNGCEGSFGEVQRSFGASNARSGPIRLAQVWEGEAVANSFESCSPCTYFVVARIGIEQNQQENAADVNAPPVALRVFHEAENNPSQNQSLDCDPVPPNPPNLREEIASGCAPAYTRNQGTACPSQSTLLNDTEPPWECVAIQTGGAVNQVYQGMSKRVFGTEEPKTGECTHPNEWATFPDLDFGNDPRIVSVFLTAFGSFSGSGNGTVPVTNFATFYVTGWAGQGGGNTSQSICPGDDPAEAGTIVGHFIKYVDSLNEGGASDEPCNFESLTPCEPVLTE